MAQKKESLLVFGADIKFSTAPGHVVIHVKQESQEIIVSLDAVDAVKFIVAFSYAHKEAVDRLRGEAA